MDTTIPTSLTCLVAIVIVLLLPAPMPATAQPSHSAALRAKSELSTCHLAVRVAGVRRPAADRWLGFDKLKHLTFSFLWTLSAQYVLVDKAQWSNRAALPASAGSSAVVGLSKELFDWRVGSTGQFSTRDLAADGAGILLAVGVIVL